ncbi:MAG TPA: hypothetical protein DD730_18770 [Desulfosporosinus sp.]|jgi:hypothetical protein|nr:hypothetical protein [Desulfosporosinus sp.]
MAKAISGFSFRYIVDRTITATSTKKIQIKKTCDNCYEAYPLCDMSNGLKCCEPCSKDVETITNRLPPTEERS